MLAAVENPIENFSPSTPKSDLILKKPNSLLGHDTTVRKISTDTKNLGEMRSKGPIFFDNQCNSQRFFNDTHVPESPEVSSYLKTLRKDFGKRKALNSPAHTAKVKREEYLAEVEEELNKIQSEFSDFDIGPFYGLPSKVETPVLD